MTEEQLERFMKLAEEDASWWGHEEGYTWEEGSDHYERLAEEYCSLLHEIEVR